MTRSAGRTAASAHGAGRTGPPSGPPDPRVRHATPRWVLVVSLALGWASALATALLFVLVGDMLDLLPVRTGLDSGASATGSESSAADGRTSRPGGYVFAAVCAVVAAVCSGAGAWFSEWAASSTETRLRRAVVSAVFRGGSVRASAQTGRLLASATTSVEKAAQYRASFLGPITASLTVPLLVLLVMALAVDAVTAGILALLILLVPLLIGGFQRLVRPVGGAYRRSQAALTTAFLDAIQALETLVYARAADRQAAVLAARGEAHRKTLMSMLAVNQLLILVVDAAFSLGVTVAAAVVTTVRVTSGDMSVGEGLTVMLLTTLVIGPVDVVGQFFYIGIAGRASETQIGTILRSGDAGVEGAPTLGRTSTTTRAAEPVASASGAHGGTIELDGVSAGWPGGADVLTDISLRVERGERVALVGPSGTGKSTLAALVEGHLAPRRGSVRVDGLDPIADTGAVRGRIAAVEQRAFLFLGSIADNLRLAAPGADDAQLWSALERAGLADEVAAMPAGLDTQVGEQGALLSGGQSQRLAIARAWLQDAPVLVLDEPTSQIDLAAETRILGALDQLAAKRTVLMIAHRPGAILAADRVVSLGEGS